MEKLRAVIGIKIAEGGLEETIKEIAKREEIIAAYEVTGEFDIIAIGAFDGTLGLEKFIKDILKWKTVDRTVTFVVLYTIKEGYQ